MSVKATSARRLVASTRRTTLLAETHPLFAVGSPVAALLDELPEELTEGLTRRQRADLARAQAAWIRRHLTLDPRLSRYSRRATTDELHIAIRILRGLFSLADADELTLSAALRFAAHLHDTAREAEGWGVRPALPLPHIWMAGAELDAAEAAVEADGYAEN